MVVAPSGEQTGYQKASDSYVNNIANASYGIEVDIEDTEGGGQPLSNMNYFGMGNPTNGTYELHVISKQPGPYRLDISIAWGPMNGSTTSVDGTLAAGDVDEYTVTFPEGDVQRVNH